MATRAEQREISYQQVKDAALDLFVTQGFHGTTLREIAAKAGCSQGNIYHYFKTKNDLAVDLAYSLNEELSKEEWDIVIAAPGTRNRVYRLMEHFFKWVKKSPHAFLYLFNHEAGKATENGRPPVAELTPAVALERLIIEGQEAGEIKEGAPADLEWCFALPTEFARYYARGMVREEEFDAFADKAAEMIWCAIRSDSAALRELQTGAYAQDEKGGDIGT